MARTDKMGKAFAYLRTSSAANIGEDKDSGKRQLAAIEAFAKRRGFVIEGVYSDDAVSGEDDIASRPGFSSMLDALENNGVKTVIVEDASRFARKVIVQEPGIVTLITREVVCWSAAGDLELTKTDDEFKVAMRQIAAAFAQLEKARLVKKLKAARDRKRAAGEKVEGRKSIAETKPERSWRWRVRSPGRVPRAASGHCVRYPPSWLQPVTQQRAAGRTRRPRSN